MALIAAGTVGVAHHGALLVAATKSSGLSLGQILNPLYEAIAGVLAFFYSLIPNYAVAIVLLTVAIMVVLSPLTWKSTRSMIAMQRLAPEMKKLQQKYKGDRETLNREVMNLYKEQGVSPAGGCLPMVLQFPILFVLYSVIRGLTNTVGPHHIPDPKYISHTSLLYHNLIAGHGQMYAFGLNLAKSAISAGGGIWHVLPYWVLVIAGVGFQYLQMRRLTARNPQAASANPQAQAMQRFMPLIFGFVYIYLQAAVNVYMLVSSLARLLQQELMYRYDPVVKAQMGAAQASASPSGATSALVPRSGSNGDSKGQRETLGQRLLQSLRGEPPTSATREASSEQAREQRGSGGAQKRPVSSRGPASSSNGSSRRRGGARGPGGSDGAGGANASRTHSRSRDKRPRRAR
ncbi:MAG: membrane protein insertase YidC [Acidimicrobiales bacterium]|nr:membrane protein insertase YidC [Acidimicrobiales bacterium]